MRKLVEFIKKHKIITIVLIAAILLLAKSLLFKDESAGYLQENAEKRDIITYNSFVGNVEPASDIQLVAQASEEVVSVAVKMEIKSKPEMLSQNLTPPQSITISSSRKQR